MNNSFHSPLSRTRNSSWNWNRTCRPNHLHPKLQTLSKDLSDSLQEISQGLITIQNQLDSLAALVLQNRRRLDLFTVEKGGFCLFLDEFCCFYANQLAHFSESSHNNKSGCYKFTCTQAQPFPSCLIFFTFGLTKVPFPSSTCSDVHQTCWGGLSQGSRSSVMSWVKEPVQSVDAGSSAFLTVEF